MKAPWYRRWLGLGGEPVRVGLFPHVPIGERECPRCREVVTVWRTYGDGQIRCVGCGDLERP